MSLTPRRWDKVAEMEQSTIATDCRIGGGANGSKTSITIVPLNCNNSGGGCGIITNEMWLLNKNEPGCAFENQCWVEVGYWNAPGNGYSESYFWADNRPGSLVIIHFFGDIPAGDYNVSTAFTIAHDCGSTCYDVNVAGAKDSFHGLSTNNTMNPTSPDSVIRIGMEVAGSNSDAASAGHAYFTYNQWESSSGTWNYQTNCGAYKKPPYCAYNPDSDAPPWMEMITQPVNGNNGGSYRTRCCTPTSIATHPAQVPSNAPASPAHTLGLPAITAHVRQQNGAMIDSSSVASWVLSHPLPRATRNGSLARPTGIQKIVFAKSQDISKLLDGENMGVPDNTLLCYAQVSGVFEFPSPSRGKEFVYHQGIEVFDATTGNLLMVAG
ncbi:MAG: hypothetical protein ABI068_11360 [Ktedonobacterales bacterium]